MEPSILLNKEDRDILLQVAQASIFKGLQEGHPLRPQVADYSPILQIHKATFVTLQSKGDLRGCIGTIEAHRPLIADVAHNAFHAAFEDYRFPKLSAWEFSDLEISISILSSPISLSFSSEEDLLEKIKVFEDGLILMDKHYKSVFLPAVWEDLPDPKDFLRHLKQKAGLAEDYWSNTITVQKFAVESVK